MLIFDLMNYKGLASRRPQKQSMKMTFGEF